VLAVENGALEGELRASRARILVEPEPQRAVVQARRPREFTPVPTGVAAPERAFVRSG
jgi:hypothetical protein